MSPRSLTAVSGLFAAVVLCLCASPVLARDPAVSAVKVRAASKFERTQPLRDMRWSLPPVMQRILRYQKGPVTATRLQALRQQLVRSGELPPAGKIRELSPPSGQSSRSSAQARGVHDLVLQRSMPPAAATAGGFTQPIASFDGLGHSTGLDIQFVPPDANSAVGEKYVIEMVNADFGIYNKETGKLALGPVPNNALWTGFGGPCENHNDGYPSVAYDQLAHRWILSQFAIVQVGSGYNSYQCVAVSQTDDPTGAYYLYAFEVSAQKPLSIPTLAVWTDAYYAADTYSYLSPFGSHTEGAVFAAFDRAAMLAGDPAAQMVTFDVSGTSGYFAQPASLDGYNPPPTGAPGLFIISTKAGFFRPVQVLALRQLHVDWTDPTGATLTNPVTLTVDPFTQICPGTYLGRQLNCLTQPRTPQELDAIGDGLMYRLAYRNLGDHQALVVNQTVGVDTSGGPPAGIRWYELDAPSGAIAPTAWTIAQQSTFAPAAGSSGNSRWLGSLAMDNAGNMALGYSLVGPDTDPSIAYTGRHAGDPANEMTEPETILQAGGGEQTGSNLWGAYSSMAVAPDDCTFWYTNEYYASTSNAFWSTHIGAFKFPDCTPASQGTLEGTVTDASGGQPVADAKIIINPGDIVTKTDAQGRYSIELVGGSYTVATKIFGYAPGSGSVTITGGVTTTQDFQLNAAARATVSGQVTDGSGHDWGLYAEIKAFTPDFGQVADIWSDPKTGAYSLSLPQGSDYTLQVTPYNNGYQPASAALTDLSGEATQNFSLDQDGSCTAPGYYSFNFNQDFNGTSFPPDGWTVTNDVAGSPVVWKLNPQWVNPLNGVKDGNFTGGSGTAADIDADNAYPYRGNFGSSLVSPPVAVTSLPAQPVLRFLMNYQGYPATALDVDIRVDGGAWQNVAHYSTTSYGGNYELPGTTQRYDLGSHIPSGASTIQLRWHYYYITGTHYRGGYYAEVDDVQLGTCSLVPGGLVLGQVTNKNNGFGVAGATVSDDAGYDTKTIDNLADPDLSRIGYYFLFSPTGDHTLSASKLDYQSVDKAVNVSANSVKEEDISLDAGHIKDNPASLDVHVVVNSQKDDTLSLQNDGSAPTHYRIVEANRPLPPATGTGQAAAAPLPLPAANGASAVAFKASLCPSGAVASCATQTPWTAKKFEAPAAGSAPGTVVNTFFTHIPGTYSLGFNRDAEDLWVGSASLEGGDDKDYQFQTDGTPTSATIDVSSLSSAGFEADMAYDANTGTFWQIGISLTTGFCIYELDPLTMRATGRRICPAIGVYQEALAYDPTTNTWYSGDFTTHNIYHFDASGKVLDFAYNAGGGEPIIGLTYDPGNGYLFATASGSAVDVGVYDTRNNYAFLGAFKVGDLNGLEGAGFSHDCAGHLWISSVYNNEVYEADSGVGGWCDFKQIPWLSETPASGTVASGASAQVALDFDGTGQTPYTSTHSQFLVQTDTPYNYLTVPVTVHWDPQPVDLKLTGSASPSPVKKGNSLVYSLTVANAAATGVGPASDVTLSYELPSGVSYVSGSGAGVSCTGPGAGSASAPAVATSGGTGSCAVGTLAPGASRAVTLAVNANEAGTLTSTFGVSAREPDDSDSHTLSLQTTVIGTADVSASGQGATIAPSATGTLHMGVKNAGPDTATDVVFKVSSGSDAKLLSATSDQGTCSLISGQNALSCDLGDVASGQEVSINVSAYGAYAGTATVTGQVTTSATDPDQSNDVVTATVTVAASGGGGGSGGSSGGGGGALGLLALAALLGLALAAAVWKRCGGLGRYISRFNILGEKVRMTRGLLASVLAAFVLAMLIGTGFGAAPAWAQDPSVSTLGSGADANGRSLPNLVTMAPQSTLSLLKRATLVGAHAKDATISLTFGLKLRNEAALHRFLQAVQDPRSPQYHEYLTPAEFTAEYGPSKSQVETLAGFLGRWGIEVTGVSPNRLLVHTSGSTSAYEHALEIRINDYSLNGRSFYSTENSPKLPAGIAPFVVNILGLNHGMQMRPMSHYEPLGAKGGVGSKVTAKVPTPPAATSAYFNPSQIAAAYDWPSITDGNNGEGVSTAILTADSSGLATEDSPANFWSAYGLPDHTVNVIPVDGDSGLTDGMVETLLDMEWSGAMSPGEALNVYVAGNANLSTFADMYNQLVTDNTSQVMTTSWGIYESADPSLFQSDDQIFEEAAAQGISMFAAAGDNGSSDGAPSGDDNADYPSSSLYVTASNGTELTADVDGNYISESAWSDTGGATSQIFAQPGWQTGPGVPDSGWRMNSDMALNAGSLHPFLLYVDGQWGLVWGTSAVAPQFAGLFAIGVSQNGEVSLGQSNSLLYNDVNAGNYASDFRDVTTGCNGAYCAGTDWDHPTGWGSPKAASLLSHLGIQGPRGTIAGTVTDAASGLPIAGAKVAATPGVRHGSTGDQGKYSFDLPVGSYTVTVTDYGYQTGTAMVNITDGNTTTQDFQLQAAPTATISGHVKDGSGHGWGLYAEVKATTPGFGQVADAWTNPRTGAYSLNLPEGYEYTLSVTPYFDYNPGSATLNLTGDTTQNFVLPSPACDAPGYHFGGLSEDFNGTSFPPDGWTTTATTNLVNWRFNMRPPGTSLPQWNDDNFTGGSGASADINDDKASPYSYPYDSSLISPPITLASPPGDPVLQFRLNYQHNIDDALDIDLQADGGSWQTVAHLTSSYGGFYALPGAQQSYHLGAYIPPGTSTIRLRWRYYRTTYPYHDWYAQVDDVRVGACQLLAGGMVEGQITDKNTGNGLVGATVSDDAGAVTKTIVNPDDPNLPSGYYFLFASSGDRTLSASSLDYQDGHTRVTVADNSVNKQNIALAAGQLTDNPNSLDVHVTVNGSLEKTLALQNTGTAAAHYQVVEANEPVPPASGPGAAAATMSAPPVAAGPIPKSFRATLCDNGTCGRSAAPAARTASGPGSVVSQFDSGLHGTYGLGVDHDANNLWIGSISLNSAGGDDRDHQFLFDGTVTGKTVDVSSFSPGGFEADMAYDDNTGMLWQIGSEKPSQFCIHEIDPASASLTGREICPNISYYQSALAYDPLTNTWYSGDINTDIIYHFDASGQILDFKNVGIPVIGLTYNPATGHLFASVSAPGAAVYDVYVIDAKNDYKIISSFNIPGMNGGAGAGLGHDCEGHLWAVDYIASKVYEVNSGETGWCDFKAIPWLSETPVSGTVASGASAQVALDFDGTGQTPYTSTHSQLVVRTDTPYGLLRLPVTVYWDPQPVALKLTGSASPNPVTKGNGVTYTLTVKNLSEEGHGTASLTTLSYALPAGASYVSGSGAGVSCTGSGAGSASAPAVATSAGTVSCDFGTLAQGAAKTVALAVQANEAGTLTSTFGVSAREPDDSGSHTLSLQTTVIGTADVSASGQGATIALSSTGTLHMGVKNAGPDTATDVVFKVSSGENAKLLGATSDQGTCSLISGQNALSCDLGDVASGQEVNIDVSAYGAYAGTAMVTGQATTSATDPDQSNNVVTATVTVAASGGGGGSSGSSGGGGGALGWLALAALLGLALAGVRRRKRC